MLQNIYLLSLPSVIISHSPPRKPEAQLLRDALGDSEADSNAPPIPEPIFL